MFAWQCSAPSANNGACIRSFILASSRVNRGSVQRKAASEGPERLAGRARSRVRPARARLSWHKLRRGRISRRSPSAQGLSLGSLTAASSTEKKATEPELASCRLPAAHEAPSTQSRTPPAPGTTPSPCWVEIEPRKQAKKARKPKGTNQTLTARALSAEQGALGTAPRSAPAPRCRQLRPSPYRGDFTRTQFSFPPTQGRSRRRHRDPPPTPRVPGGAPKAQPARETLTATRF